MAGPRIFSQVGSSGLSQFFWIRQDAAVIVILLVMLIMMRRAVHGRAFAPRIARWQIWLAAAVVFLLTWSGHHWLMGSYNLSRDEQMVLFDADIVARGQMLAMLPADWVAASDALNRSFTLPLANQQYWVSAYLPGNAALHSLFGRLGDAHAAAPFLAAVAILALWRCARHLWPADPAPQAVALLCMLMSAQMLVTATTTYAMTAHLALNLVWLALFLRDRWWGYALLLPVGFLATGLHQPIFHPLFVAPFLLLLIERRNWRVLTLLVAGYGAIGLFWLGWPALVSAAAQSGPSHAAAGADYMTRLFETLGGWEPQGLWLMSLNLLRFAAWQHLLLLPLVAAALATGWRSNGLVRALALGVLLTVAAMIILLPYQGHGWGYRYLHGLIGNLCLLAGFGWFALRERGWDSARLMGWSSAATMIAILWLVGNAHYVVAPYAAIDRQIAANGADYVLIDNRAAPFAQDLVFNPPFLDQRPVRLAGSQLPPDSAAGDRLCRDKAMAVVGPPALSAINRYFGQETPTRISVGAAAARDRWQSLGCRIVAP